LQVWPEFQRHDVVVERYWHRLYESFPEFQLIFYDEAGDEVVAESHAIPCVWDGTIAGLPDGVDDVLQKGFSLGEAGGRANALSALAIEVATGWQRRGISTAVIRAMVSVAGTHGFADVIAPLRPTLKERFPKTPIDQYVTWTRDDGTHFDPWIRTHQRLGAEILRPVERSLEISGTVADWERWTGLRFADSGPYAFPGGLATLQVDVERDRGTYWEPNVWMRHRVPRA
jgi:GNAT superfamily N-acetyltransferase